MEQLKENIQAFEIVLTEDMLQQVGEVFKRFPLPY
jgi:aryl-alcohol dehydrogenase-like predicted oxidoreductase